MRAWPHDGAEETPTPENLARALRLAARSLARLAGREPAIAVLAALIRELQLKAIPPRRYR
ncbi:MAG: hypothetical protein ACREEQ_01905 [Caulobacteraceae bacterium]